MAEDDRSGEEKSDPGGRASQRRKQFLKQRGLTEDAFKDEEATAEDSDDSKETGEEPLGDPEGRSQESDT